jgi:hypothetical protein
MAKGLGCVPILRYKNEEDIMWGSDASLIKNVVKPTGVLSLSCPTVTVQLLVGAPTDAPLISPNL